jgi:hypothetical protein
LFLLLHETEGPREKRTIRLALTTAITALDLLPELLRVNPLLIHKDILIQTGDEVNLEFTGQRFSFRIFLSIRENFITVRRLTMGQ